MSCVGSYIDSPNWIKNKKAKINCKNNEKTCFQYAVTAALNHEKIGNTKKIYQKLRLL